MLHQELPVPAGLPAWREREVARLRDWIRNDTDDLDGILRWKTNGRVVPETSYRDAFCEPPPGSVDTERRENAAFLDEYRRNPPRHSDETLAEMRNEFGEGATVVDVVSGRRTVL
jgi:hypothetical protein